MSIGINYYYYDLSTFITERVSYNNTNDCYHLKIDEEKIRRDALE